MNAILAVACKAVEVGTIETQHDVVRGRIPKRVQKRAWFQLASSSLQRHVSTHANTPTIGRGSHFRQPDAILFDLDFLKTKNHAGNRMKGKK